jgi:hypothetical protein
VDWIPPKSITLAHWYWTFVILVMVLGLWWASVSLFLFHEKTSPSPLNAWLLKPLVMVAFHGGWDVVLPGPILKVGPHVLSIFSHCSIVASRISGAVFCLYYI